MPDYETAMVVLNLAPVGKPPRAMRSISAPTSCRNARTASAMETLTLGAGRRTKVSKKVSKESLRFRFTQPPPFDKGGFGRVSLWPPCERGLDFCEAKRLGDYKDAPQRLRALPARIKKGKNQIFLLTI